MDRYERMIEEAKKEPLWSRIIAGILFFGILGAAFSWGIYKWHQLNYKPARYTIATVKRYYRHRLSRKCVYVYRVDKKNYEGDATDREDFGEGTVLGGRYYLKFAVEDPDNCELYQNKPVPDSIKTAPSEGWLKIPGEE